MNIDNHVLRVPVLLLLVLAALCCGSRAAADPVLLATYDESSDSATAPASDPHVRFSLGLFMLDDPPTGAVLTPNIMWGDGEQGSFDMRDETVAMFDQFAALASDGVDGRYMSGAALVGALGRGRTGPESELFGHSPDLVGFRLELVRLTVQELDIIPFEIDQLDGFEFTYDITYEFFGTVIPEPTTLILLLVGGLFVCPARRAIRMYDE